MVLYCCCCCDDDGGGGNNDKQWVNEFAAWALAPARIRVCALSNQSEASLGDNSIACCMAWCAWSFSPISK